VRTRVQRGCGGIQQEWLEFKHPWPNRRDAYSVASANPLHATMGKRPATTNPNCSEILRVPDRDATVMANTPVEKYPLSLGSYSFRTESTTLRDLQEWCGYCRLPKKGRKSLLLESLPTSAFEPTKKRGRGSMKGSRGKTSVAKRIEKMWPASEMSKEFEEHRGRGGAGKRASRRLTDLEITHNNELRLLTFSTISQYKPSQRASRIPAHVLRKYTQVRPIRHKTHVREGRQRLDEQPTS